MPAIQVAGTPPAHSTASAAAATMTVVPRSGWSITSPMSGIDSNATGPSVALGSLTSRRGNDNTWARAATTMSLAASEGWISNAGGPIQRADPLRDTPSGDFTATSATTVAHHITNQ